MRDIIIFRDVTILHSTSQHNIEMLVDYSMAVDTKSGKILEIKQSFDTIVSKGVVKTLRHDQIIIPGFIDTHSHGVLYQ